MVSDSVVNIVPADGLAATMTSEGTMVNKFIFAYPGTRSWRINFITFQQFVDILNTL